MITIPDYSEVKDEMIAVRYRNQENEVRHHAINACENKGVVLELYAGVGGNTETYKKEFKRVITNDINPKSIASHIMPAMKFIKTLSPIIGSKIDLVDFDCYGCPSEEIKAFFEERDSQDAPLVVVLADGLGLWMKRAQKDTRTARIRRRYLLPDTFIFDEEHPWRDHVEIENKFMDVLATRNGMHAIPLRVIHTKFKNYVIGAYLFNYVRN